MTDQTNTPENPSRRTLLVSASLGAAAASLSAAAVRPAMAMTDEWDKTFEKSDAVTHRKVRFENRYGNTLVGDFYVPKDAEGALPAIAVAGPFGAVKEQAAGLYAQTMAERGFATIAFDPSYVGESGGLPRNVASPDVNTEDFMAAVDFLGLHPSVDRERIGVIGICGFSGMALNAVAADKRVKAVATSTMYDMSRQMGHGYNDSMSTEDRTETLTGLSYQRWEDTANGSPAYLEGFPEERPEEAPQFVKEYWDYYMTDRGFHPRAVNGPNGWSKTTPMSFMNMPLLSYISEITPRPILLIHGENAHSRYFSEAAFDAAAEPKELLIVPGAVHTDLYDQVDLIPFDKIQSFFEGNLA